LITHVCGIAEWWVDRVHCIKIERTPEALAAVLREILDGDLDLEPIARRTAAVARRDFHLDHIIPKIEAVLERAAAARGAGGDADGGDPAEAYRLCALADRLTRTLIQEGFGRH
jgi:hypothetical protein